MINVCMAGTGTLFLRWISRYLVISFWLVRGISLSIGMSRSFAKYEGIFFFFFNKRMVNISLYVTLFTIFNPSACILLFLFFFFVRIEIKINHIIMLDLHFLNFSYIVHGIKKKTISAKYHVFTVMRNY